MSMVVLGKWSPNMRMMMAIMMILNKMPQCRTLKTIVSSIHVTRFMMTLTTMVC